MKIRNLTFLLFLCVSIFAFAADNQDSIKSLTNLEQFKKEVIENPKPVLVKFYATWCPPCSRMKSVLHNIANNYKDKICVFEVNVDSAKAISTERNVKALPTVIFFLNGQEKTRTVGFKSETQLKETIKQNFKL